VTALKPAQWREANAWLQDHAKSPPFRSSLAQDGTSCDQVAGCHRSLQGKGIPMKTRDQNTAQSNSSTLHVASDPTSPTSVHLYKTSASDTSSSTLHLSKKIKVLRRPVETAAQSRRSITVRLTTASNRRMSDYRATPLKSLKHLHFGNGDFLDVVQT